MTVRKTAYDTAACSGYVTKRTIDAVKVAAAHGFVDAGPAPWTRLVQGGSSIVSDIPSFAHPLLVDDYLAVDMRQFGKYINEQAKFVVRNESEYKLALHRAALNALWIKDSPTILQNISALPLAVYVSWISEAVSRRFALDPGEQYKFAILCGVLYCSLFVEEDSFDEREKVRMVSAITRATRSSATDVMAVVDQVGSFLTLSTFCQRAEQITGSVRLQELNVGVLFSILGGTWFGANAKEMVAVAVEHPPTWMAILVAAYNERTFKNSAITKLTERSGNKVSGQDYVRAVLNLLAVTSK